VVSFALRWSGNLKVGTPVMILDSSTHLRSQGLSLVECEQLAAEIRDFVVAAVSRTGGTSVRTSVSSSSHSPCTGLQLPEDILLFDTGHQAYIHRS